MNNKAGQLAPALGKGMETLELLAASSSPLSLSRIARSLGRSVSEMQRIVKVLENLGYLVRDNQGGYLLTTRLLQLGRHYPPFRWLTDIALPEMETFTDLSGESVHLCVLTGSSMLILDQVVGRQLVNVSLDVGSTQPLMKTVSGRLLLSGLEEAELPAYLERLRISPGKRRGIIRELTDLRHKGWLASPSNYYRGLGDLGVAVKDSHNRTCAALTTTWIQTIDERKKIKTILKLLQDASRRIQSRLAAGSRP
jgi:DNA-binding IclR family transcriptional regulator